jgi:hypothetical protein
MLSGYLVGNTARLATGAPATELYPSIFSPARPEPGPPRPWILLDGPGQRSCCPRKKIVARARPEMLFLAILHYKNMGGPPKPGPAPSPTRKTRPAAAHGTGVGKIFSARKTRVFSARPEPGPSREMLRYTRNSVFRGGQNGRRSLRRAALWRGNVWPGNQTPP